MRRIDADALIKSMKSHTVEDNGLTDDYKAGLTDSIRTAVTLAENASTIEAVPAVRGEWIKKSSEEAETLALCSKCSYPISWWYKTNHCPNCGAKMEDKPWS